MVKLRPDFILEGPGARWAAALLVFALATGLRAALDPVVHDRLPLLPYLPALAAVGLISGVWPGLALMAVSALTLLVFWEANLVVVGLFFIAGGVALAISAYARSVVREARLLRGRLNVALSGGRMAAWEWNVRTGAVTFSEGAEGVFGCKWDELENAWKLAHPDDVDHVRQVVDEALRSGQQYGFMNRMHRADTGELRWIETHGHVHRGRDGRPVHVTGVTIDVTERQQALQTSQTAQLRLELALRCGDVIAWECDGDMRYTWVCNPRLGMQADAFIGKKVGEVSGRERCPAFVEAVEGALRDGEFRQFQMSFEHDGQTLHYLCAVQPQKDGAGRVVKLIGASTDITPLCRAQTQLETEIRRKDTFLATLAHELRNPMAPIRYAVTMLQGQSPEGHRAQAVEVIRRQSAHMARLLDDLLDMSRITRNVIELKRERLDLRDVVRQAIDSATASVESAGHALHASLSEAPAWVDGDPTRLQQVLGNLLDNAVKYTPAGGRIGVSLAAGDGLAVLKVSDSGLGLSDQMLSRVFELFTQMHRREVPESGLGIGLAVVKQLVELHGGSILAESPGLHRGSTFIVNLPLCEAPAHMVLPPVHGILAADADGARNVSRHGVLVVDDNEDGADMLAIYLADDELDVRVAYDGKGALAAFDQHHPDVVLLDLGLPDATGFEIARAMRARAHGRHVKLVALTGWGQEADRARSAEAGFDQHLVKPVEPAELRRRILALLADRIAGTHDPSFIVARAGP